MAILSAEDRDYLKNEFSKITEDVNIAFFATNEQDKCEHCDNIRAIIAEIDDLSKHLKFNMYDIEKDAELAAKYRVKMAPALVFTQNETGNIKYYGVPSGYEFSSFIDDIMDIGTKSNDLDDEVKKGVSEIQDDVHIMVFVTPTCPYCPAAVRTAHKFAMLNENIQADMVEAYEFGELADKFNVQGVPRVIINEKEGFEGALQPDKFLEKIKESL